MDSGGTSDDEVSSPAGEGIVRDILIEAIRRSPGGAVSGMYLATWEGHADLECSWVRDYGMSKATKDWWLLERELRYPGYATGDFPIYDEKHNSLGFSPSAERFRKRLDLPVTLGHAAPEDSFLSFVADASFNSWNFVMAMSGEISMELFLRITETLVDGDRKVPVKDPPLRKRPRLIVTSTTSEEDKEPDSLETAYRYRGQPAYLVREIRGERTVRGQLQYHVYWQGYDSSEATWEPAVNVNREAVNIWNLKKRKFQ